MTDLATNGVTARHSSATNEHYTPPEIVEAARVSLCGFKEEIDLDPFSCEAANRMVKARRFYSLAAGEDGYALPWFGRVFCNPPGGKDEESNASNQKDAWFRLAGHYRAGLVRAAIFVCFSVELLQTTQVDPPPNLPIPLDFAICFPARRVAYYRDPVDVGQAALFDGEPRGLVKGKSPPHASCVIFLPRPDFRDHDVDRFRRAFAGIGRVK